MNKQETINVVDFNNMFFSNQTEDNSRDEFNVETFFADEDLESVFEFYDRRRPREQKTLTKSQTISRNVGRNDRLSTSVRWDDYLGDIWHADL
jgi:hypothetical protein